MQGAEESKIVCKAYTRPPGPCGGVLPDVEELEQFWDCMEGHPQLIDHPVKDRPNWKKLAIPLCIHGDGVPLTGVGKSWSKFMDVFSVSSILGRGSTRQKMSLLWSCFFFTAFIVWRNAHFRLYVYAIEMVVASSLARQTSYT